MEYEYYEKEMYTHIQHKIVREQGKAGKASREKVGGPGGGRKKK